MRKNKINKCLNCDNAVSIYSKYCDKCKHYLSIKYIYTGDKVVYMPNRSSIIRGITDNAYIDFEFLPGDSFTVKEVQSGDGGFDFVIVEELSIRFSPFELVPFLCVESEMSSILDKLFQSLLRKFEN